MKKRTPFVMLLLLYLQTAFGQQPYVGEIRLFAGNFAPSGWNFCDGSLLSIAENEVLFILIGTTYGGDGETTFALPDLRGRVPVGTSSSQSYVIGQTNGVEKTTLTNNNLPEHKHTVQISVSNTNATLSVPTANSSLAIPGTLSGRLFVPATSYTNTTPSVTTSSVTTSSVGNSTPINNMKPYIGINYIISLYGIFPSSN